jgi:alpha-amylase
VLIKTSPAGHTIPGANGHGYSIWAPVPTGLTLTSVSSLQQYLMTYSPARSTGTVQEWEMANDLGDSHVNSLRQGGSLPTNSTAERIVGRIYAMSSTPVRILLYPEVNSRRQTLMIYNASGTILSQITGTSTSTTPLALNYTPTSTGWLSIRVKNGASNTAAMKVWVNVSYTAPSQVNTRTSPGNLREGFGLDEEELFSVSADKEIFASVYPNPSAGDVYFEFSGINAEEEIRFSLCDIQGKELFSAETDARQLQALFNSRFRELKQGIYLLSLKSGRLNQQVRLVKSE